MVWIWRETTYIVEIDDEGQIGSLFGIARESPIKVSLKYLTRFIYYQVIIVIIIIIIIIIIIVLLEHIRMSSIIGCMHTSVEAETFIERECFPIVFMDSIFLWNPRFNPTNNKEMILIIRIRMILVVEGEII